METPAALALARLLDELVTERVAALRQELLAELRAELSAAAQDPDEELTEKQAAEFLKLSPKTLQGWRRLGGGPRFTRYGEPDAPGGRVTYRRRDLIAFAETKKRWNNNRSVADGPRTTAAERCADRQARRPRRGR